MEVIKGGQTKKPYKLHPCEMCGEAKLTSEHDSVCAKCDEELKAEEKKFIAAQRAQQTKRACRLCYGPLEATRYFACETCMPDLESEEDPALEALERMAYVPALNVARSKPETTDSEEGEDANDLL